MLRRVIFALLISGMTALIAAPAFAGGKNGTRVKGYSERRGGYSYQWSDSINTYGDSRSNFGAGSVYRDPNLDRQTNAGPFDHGFFFDSGINQRGGDSPYMN